MKTNLKKVEKIANKFDNNFELIQKELKKVQSQKCRLKKRKVSKTYQEDMQNILNYEQILKEAKQLLNPKEKPVTMYTQKDCEKLNYEELIKAIRSIQSKKTLTRYLMEDESKNEEYQNALKIENWLIEQRNLKKPIEETVIRKSDLQTIIETIKESGKISQERIIELLESLI